MQRHGDDNVCAFNHLVARPLQPYREVHCHVGAVAVLELQHQGSAMIVIDESGAGLSVDRPLRHAGAAKKIVGHCLIEGQTANAAMGRSDERETAKTCTAQVAWRVDDGRARQTLRRENRIQE